MATSPAINWNGLRSDVGGGLSDVLAKAQAQVSFPIVIRSSYRDPATNAAVGGVKGSAHLENLAVDISLKGLSNAQRSELVAALSRAGAARMIAYSGNTGLHIDMRQGYTPQKGFLSYAMFDKKAANMGRAPSWYTDGLKMAASQPQPVVAEETPAAPIPVTRPAALNAIDNLLNNAAVTPALSAFSSANNNTAAAKPTYTQPTPWAELAAAAPAQNNILSDAYSAAVNGATNLFGSLFGGNNQTVAPPYFPPTPWTALAAQASTAPAASAGPTSVGQMRDTVTLPIDSKSIIEQIKAAVPLGFLASDQKIIDEVTKGLPPYIKFDPVTNTITYSDLKNAKVAADLAAGPNTGKSKVDAIFKPIADQVSLQASIPIPLPREARPSTSTAPQPSYQPNMLGRAPSANFGTSYDPARTLAVTQGMPVTSTWGSMAAAKPIAALPPTTAPKITPIVSPWSAMAAAGPMGSPAAVPSSTYGVTDPLSPVERAYAANPAGMASRVAAAAPASVPPPVAPPPVYTWTTSSWLPSAPPTPATRPGTTTKPEAKTGLFGNINPLGMLSGFLSTAMKPTVAPRGQFGQPLAVGGTYRNGAVWAADGSGYGGSPGQSTWGLKPGDRVYDTNTGEWGLKVGQPVTWTGGTSGNTSTATGTFQGSSTGRTYNVGQQYTAGGYVYTAMPDGTFKKV